MPLGENIQNSLIFQGQTELVAIIAFIIAIIATFIAYRRTNPATTKARRVIFITLRVVAFLLILAALMEPLWVRRGILSIEPEAAVILDDTKSVGLSDSTKAIEIFNMSQSILLERYENQEYYLAESLRVAERHTFDGDITAIGNSLLALRNIALTPDENGIRPNIAAAVLVSDGQNNLGEDPVSTASKLPFPIYTIGVGRTQPPKNIAVRRIVSNKIGYKDIPTKILAYVEGWGVDSDIEVLFKKGANILDRKTIKPGQRGEQVEVEFELMPKDTGQNYYRIVTPIMPDEMIKNDNTRSFSMEILPSRKRILLAFTDLGWEYTFVKRALEQNEHYEIASADYSGKLKDDFIPPRNDDEYADYDAIMLVNFSSSRTNCRDLRNYIQNGGSVLHVMGPQTRFCGDLLEVSPIEKMPRGWTADRFNPIVSIDGLSHPIMDLENIEADIEDNWTAEMPPLRGFLMIDQPKKQANILMEHPKLEGVPVLLTYDTGKSRQAIINGGDFWRWGFTPFAFDGDDRIFDMILQNIAQWLMARDEVSPFILTTDNRVYRSGEPVYFNASLRDVAGNPLEGKSIELKITRKFTDSLGRPIEDTLSAIMEESGGGFYNLRMPSMGIGDFSVRGEILKAEDAPVDVKWTTFRVEEYSTEMADLRENTEMLRRIANRSGGEYLDENNYQEYLAGLDLKAKNESLKNEYSIWDRWWLLVMVLTCLGVEWFLRKRSNLP